jgi:hypothetical protein
MEGAITHRHFGVSEKGLDVDAEKALKMLILFKLNSCKKRSSFSYRTIAQRISGGRGVYPHDGPRCQWEEDSIGQAALAG